MRITYPKVVQDRIDPIGEVRVTFGEICLAVSEAWDCVFQMVRGCLPGSMVSHGDGRNGRSDQLLGVKVVLRRPEAKCDGASEGRKKKWLPEFEEGLLLKSKCNAYSHYQYRKIQQFIYCKEYKRETSNCHSGTRN